MAHVHDSEQPNARPSPCARMLSAPLRFDADATGSASAAATRPAGGSLDRIPAIRGGPRE